MSTGKHFIKSQVEIPVSQLRIGMYVSHLDRPWLETRFLMQGFMIRNNAEIRELKEICNSVYIDIERGISTKSKLKLTAEPLKADVKLKKVLLKKHIKEQTYPDETSMEEELEQARAIKEKVNHTLESIMDDILQGKTVHIDEARDVVQDMVSSIVRNPDAMLWLTKLKSRDEYTYRHSIDTSTLAISFGRHLGLPKNALEDIAFGTLLLDIGKLKLPQYILEKPEPLTEREFNLVKRHVPVGIELAQNMKGIRSISLEIIGYHHERHNGRGYPNNLIGYNIPMYARIAALVDCYDAITSDRVYAEGISPTEALRQLYEWRDRDFQAELVEQFIQCLGVYPTGSLVELSNGTVGIIMSQNRSLRLRPKVLLILNEEKRPYDFSPVTDLAKTDSDEENDNDEAITILRTVDPEEYAIDPREYYLY